jgi:hypothetical protein
MGEYAKGSLIKQEGPLTVKDENALSSVLGLLSFMLQLAR